MLRRKGPELSAANWEAEMGISPVLMGQTMDKVNWGLSGKHFYSKSYSQSMHTHPNELVQTCPMQLLVLRLSKANLLSPM